MRWFSLLVKEWEFACLEVDVPLGMAAVIGHHRKIVQANHCAQNYGIKIGMRLSDAHSLCPELVEMPEDSSRAGRAFEAIVTVVAEIVADLQTVRPGLLIAPAGPSAKWVGGELALQKLLIETVVESTGVEAEVGIADGLVAAVWAARQSQIVPIGGSVRFLATLSLRDLYSLGLLDFPDSQLLDLINKMQTLGVSSCGQLVSIGKQNIYARFGEIGLALWRLAQGEDIALSVEPAVKQKFLVTQECNPVLENLEMAGFVAKRLADALVFKLSSKGFSGRGIEIQASSESGKTISRIWLILGDKSAKSIADRVRWQLQAWIQAGELGGSISVLTLSVVDPYPAGENPDGLWGGSSNKDKSAQRLVSHLETRLGAGVVKQPVYCGGFDPRTAVKVLDYHLAVTCQGASSAAWKGSLLEIGEWPEVVFESPIKVLLLDSKGRSVKVTAEGELSSHPCCLKESKAGDSLGLLDHVGSNIETISSVWQVWGRWWKADKTSDHYPRAYLVVRIPTRGKFLLRYKAGEWHLDGGYV